MGFTKKVTFERPTKMRGQVIKVSGRRVFQEEGRTSRKSPRWKLACSIKVAVRRSF